jgi:hypothetical protein
MKMPKLLRRRNEKRERPGCDGNAQQKPENAATKSVLRLRPRLGRKPSRSVSRNKRKKKRQRQRCLLLHIHPCLDRLPTTP